MSKSIAEQWTDLCTEYDAADAHAKSLAGQAGRYLSAVFSGGRKNPPESVLDDLEKARAEVDAIFLRMKDFCHRNA